MKRFIILLGTALTLVACGDDGNGGSNSNTGYPTDNLPLPEEKKALMLINYVPPSGVSVLTEIPRLQLADAFENDLNTVNLVLTGNPLGSPVSDQLSAAFAVPNINDINLNGAELDASDNLSNRVFDAISTQKVLATVSHKVTKNDTAWLVDAKVKFWKDTMAANRFKIETYFLANVPAYNYSTLGLDLRGADVNDLIKKGDSITNWLAPVPGLIDSTKEVISAGEEYVHQNIMLSKANPDSTFGIPIAEYTPFGFQFFENDVVGTESTPIRNYFLRPDRDDDPDNDLEFIYTPAFLTIVWSVDPTTGAPEYLNSYMSTSTP